MQIGFLKYIKKQEAFWKSNLVLDDHTAKVPFDLIELATLAEIIKETERHWPAS